MESVIISPFHFASTGGKIGVTIPSFQSSPAGGPKLSWESLMSYPAINGYTLFHEVTFFGFQNKCGKRHRAIMTNSWVGDILHPMDVRGLLRIYHSMYTFSRVSSSLSLFLLLAGDFAFAFSCLYLTITEAEESTD